MTRPRPSELALDIDGDATVARGVVASEKRVLCATDLSVNSARVVQRAAFLASQLDAQLTLLHVLAPDQSEHRSARLRMQVTQQLPLPLLPPGSKPKVMLRIGETVRTIAAVAKETEADLVVIGSSRRPPPGLLIGATAERVTALTGCPVLIVTIKPRMRYDAVVVAAEISDAFVRVARLAASLQLLDAPSVSVVHGFESPYRGPMHSAGLHPYSAQRNIREWEKAAANRLFLALDAAGIESSNFRLCYQRTRPLRDIQREIRRVLPELLIVGIRDRSMLTSIVRGSAANDVLRTLECDILVAASDPEATESLMRPATVNTSD